VLIAATTYLKFVSASNTFEKVPAIITEVTSKEQGAPVGKIVYEYKRGQEVVSISETYPEAEIKSFAVGDTLNFLRDSETGEMMRADNGQVIAAFSFKFGLAGVVIMIAAMIFLRMNPAPK